MSFIHKNVDQFPSFQYISLEEVNQAIVAWLFNYSTLAKKKNYNFPNVKCQDLEVKFKITWLEIFRKFEFLKFLTID